MDDAVRRDVIETGVKLSQALLIRSSEGNLSVRLDDSSFLEANFVSSWMMIWLLLTLMVRIRQGSSPRLNGSFIKIFI